MSVEHEIKILIKKYCEDIFQSWTGKINKKLSIIEDRLNDVDTFNAEDRAEFQRIKREVDLLVQVHEESNLHFSKCADVDDFYEEKDDEH